MRKLAKDKAKERLRKQASDALVVRETNCHTHHELTHVPAVAPAVPPPLERGI